MIASYVFSKAGAINFPACYRQDGSPFSIEMGEYMIPCSPNKTATHCCSPADYCTNNGLCLDAGGDNMFSLQGCTDKTWKTGGCHTGFEKYMGEWDWKSHVWVKDGQLTKDDPFGSRNYGQRLRIWTRVWDMCFSALATTAILTAMERLLAATMTVCSNCVYQFSLKWLDQENLWLADREHKKVSSLFSKSAWFDPSEMR